MFGINGHRPILTITKHPLLLPKGTHKYENKSSYKYNSAISFYVPVSSG